jgi:glycine/D-amino acid oxidase-like deaminating enzyme
VRACIVGGGLAGSLLAWRLAKAAAGWDVEVVVGERQRTDATAASGGAVRAYETDPELRLLAAASLVELLTSRTLRQWADFRQVESVYLRRGADGLIAAFADIEHLLPGSVELVDASELERRGWADLHSGAAAVLERLAGYISPDRLRESVLGDAAVGPRVSVLQRAVAAITPEDSGAIACAFADQRRDYDVVVVAAGPWTPALLRTSGLPAEGYRTKSIQYALYPVGDWCPPQFVDDVTGLYGRPTPDGALLLGLPTDEWDVDPDKCAFTPILHESAVRLARTRLPKLQIGPARCEVVSADCYCDRPTLSLRRVGDTDHRLFTFSGGAGGSAKTALAASQLAATQLVESSHPTQLTSVGPRKGQL